MRCIMYIRSFIGHKKKANMSGARIRGNGKVERNHITSGITSNNVKRILSMCDICQVYYFPLELRKSFE